MIFNKIYQFFKKNEDQLFGRSGRWKTIRDNFIEKNPQCAACGSKNKKLEVHHIQPYHLNPDLELDENNLIVLCDDPCHLVFGHLMNYKSWNIDVIDDCKAYLKKIKNRP